MSPWRAVTVATLMAAIALLATAITASSNPAGTGDWVLRNPRLSLYGTSCPSASVCVAVGALGTIQRTINSGTTWTPQVSGTTNTLRSVACPTTTVCVAVGDSDTEVTTSDGLNWNVRAQAPPSTTNQFTGVSCPSSSTCFATAGPIESVDKSTDGGATWTATNFFSSFGVFSISCPTTSVCFAAGYGGDVYATTDGGANWISKHSGSAYILNGINCPSTTTCVAAGILGGGLCNTPVLLVTTDGGSTWAFPALGCVSGDTWGLDAVSCPGTTTCYASAGNGRVEESTDLVSWTLTATPTTIELRSVACAGPARCVAGGDFGVLVGTTDGTNWSTLYQPVTVGLLNAVSCPTAGTCFAAGAGIGATGDAGVTWAPQTTPALDVPLAAIACADATHCVAVGGSISPNNAEVIETSDGSHWSAGSSGTPWALAGVACMNASTTRRGESSHTPVSGPTGQS